MTTTGDKARESLKLALADLSDTDRLGRAIAGCLACGDYVGLAGSLGAGKTTLARAIISALRLVGDEQEVVSPTYTLAQTYDAEAFPVTHFDLYRIERTRDIEELGLQEALENGVAIVEWPEKLGSLLPSDRLTVELRLIDNARQAEITGQGTWRARLDTLRIAFDTGGQPRGPS